MSAVTEQDWKAHARELRESGLSEREVAASVGKAASTVHAFLKREGIEAGGEDPNGSDSGSSDEAANPEPDVRTEPDAAPFTNDADRAGATFKDDNPHLTPFQRERLRLEAAAGDSSGGGDHARIGDDGSVEWEKTETYLEHIRIDGTAQTALNLGGKLATSAALKLRGRTITVGGSLRKGDRLKATIEFVVRDARSSDKVDKQTGIVVEAIDKFEAEIVDLRVES